MNPFHRRPLRIGTRGSALALRQTQSVCEALRAAHPWIEIETVEIATSGEWNPAQGETPLAALSGGKALFAKEIEDAILGGAVDCGVHSLKDMASILPEGLCVEHALPRADPRDAFLSNTVKDLEDLPAGAVVGTTSPRRQAQILALRPDVTVRPLRGNVPTRIEKLRAGQYDAIVLALAGLERLGLAGEIADIFAPETMLPACGQGIVGIEIRQDDAPLREILEAVTCTGTALAAAAERAVLQALGGDCHTPAGAFALPREDGGLWLRALLATLDGKALFFEEETAFARTQDEARALGLRVGKRLKDKA